MCIEEKTTSVTRGQYTLKKGIEERVRPNPKKMSVTKEVTVNFGRKKATSRVTRFTNGDTLYADISRVSDQISVLMRSWI